MHSNGGRRRVGKRKRDSGDPSTNRLIELLPRRETTLDQHAFVSELRRELVEMLRDYLTRSFPGSPEVASALLDDVAVRHPKHLRVKELFETVEACKHAGAQIASMKGAASSSARASVETVVFPSSIYDIACGHGLAGVLMAYRFPKLQVTCVDRKRRPCFDSYLEAFANHGKGPPLSKNLHFLEGEVSSEYVAGEKLPQNAFVLCIHGCNEVSTNAMSLAAQSGGGVCVLPCCIREQVFGVKTKSQYGRWRMEDDVRYSCQVGYLAGKYAAEKICSIDRRITNRHLAVVSSRVVLRDESAENNGQSNRTN